jgi:hypothetical protein
MVNRGRVDVDTRCMNRRPNVEHRNRLINRVSAMGQLSALVAMASTGVTAGVLAHDAKVKDLAAAQAARQVPPSPSPAPVQVRLVPRPVRTVLVRVAASPAKRTQAKAARRTAVRSAVTARSAPIRTVHPAPKPVSKPASKPATTSTGS